MGLTDYTIYDFICRNALLYPNREALVFNNIRLSHTQYKEKCDQLAAGLILSGIEKGDRVGVVAHNCHEYVILYGAAAKIGAIVLSVNCRSQPGEMEYVLRDCTPKIVFAETEYQKVVAEISQKGDFIEACYTIGEKDLLDDFFPFNELYSTEGAHDQTDISPDSGFVIIHTAAVDGRPRGALLTQTNIVLANLLYMNQFGFGPEDCHICQLPLYHTAGLCWAMAVMHAGGKNVILQRFDPELSLRLIEQEKGTIFFHFTPVLQMLMEKYEGGSFNISSLRHVVGIDKPENMKRFSEMAPHATCWVGYGQTETMVFSSCPFSEKPGSAGKPCVLSRVALFDDYDREVPVGTPGEICVRSPLVFSGYWGHEEENAYISRNGWHHTGDMGRFDKEGYLWYMGRKANRELIKPGGENVFPAEVEKAILDHEAVAEVVVIGVPDQEWGEAIKAVCTVQPGRSLEPQELIDYVASKIARYKKPKHVIFVDAMPKTPEGEMDREKVKKEHGGPQ